MSSNFNNAKIINVYYNKGDRKPYDVNGKPIAYIGEEFIGANEATELRFFFGEELDSASAIIVAKRANGDTRLDPLELVGTGVNSYFKVRLNAWYGEYKGKMTIIFKVYNGTVTYDDPETPTQIVSTTGQIIVSDIFNLEVAYAPNASTLVPPFETEDYDDWFFTLSTKLDKAQSITVTGALPTLTGGVYDDRYFYVENEGTGRLYYINGSTAIECVFGLGQLNFAITGMPTATLTAGQMRYNDTTGSLDLGLKGNHILKVGETVVKRVRNDEAVSLKVGQVVYVSGAVGASGLLLVKKASNNGEGTSSKTFGIVATAMNTTSTKDGYVYIYGLLQGIDLTDTDVSESVFSAGDVGASLWLGATGKIRKTFPTGDNQNSVFVGYLDTYGGAGSNCSIYTKIQNGYEIGELHDVRISAVADNHILRYNSTRQVWENTAELTTAESNISNLQGRMTTEEANVDNLQSRMTTAEADIDNIEDGTTIVGRAYNDKDDNQIDTTYLKVVNASATYIPLSQKGANNGVVPLNSSGKISSVYLSGEQDDFIEYADLASFPLVGEADIIYCAIDTGLIYRWTGSAYVVISPSLALGTTASTAFPGNRGLALETLTDNIVDGDQALTLKNQVITNTAVGTQPLIVNAIASTTADLQQWQVNSVNQARISNNGYLWGIGLVNIGSSANGVIDVASNGILITRNVNDTNSALRVNKNLGTGNILELKSANANKLEVDVNGWLYQNGTRLFTQPTAISNTFFGNQSGGTSTTGINNTGFGEGALKVLTSGQANIAVGKNALASLTTSNESIAIGVSAGSAVGIGSQNTVVGTYGLGIATGSSNSAFGYGTGLSITSGSNNTFVGHNAGNNASQLVSATNSTAIGNGSFTDKSNQMVFGNASVTEILLSRNVNDIKVGVGIVAPTYGLEVFRNSDLVSTGSATPLRVTGAGSTTNSYKEIAVLHHRTTATGLADGFGGFLRYTIEDSASGQIGIARIGAIRSGANTSGRLVFDTNNAGTLTEKMTILPNGNVGIGTASPTTTLTVAGTGANGIQLATTTGDGSLSQRLFFSNSTATNAIVRESTALQFRTGANIGSSSGTIRMIMNDDGRVGIGTTTLDEMLVVNGTMASPLSLQRNGGTDANNSIRYKMATQSWYAGVSTNQDYAVSLSADLTTATALMIKSTGRVGVNETAPSAQLQVKSANTTLVPLIVDTLASHTAVLQEWRINGTANSRITNTGYFSGLGLLNFSDSNNGSIVMLNAGSKIERNVADTNPALIVNLANASATGNIQVWQKSGTALAWINQNGVFFSTNVINPTSTNNSRIDLNDTGNVIRRNVADANVVLKVQQTNVSATGRIQEWIQGTTVLAYTDNAGDFYNLTGTYGTISDLRVKENIVEARDYTEDLMKLRVVKYSLKKDQEQEATKLGFIAQEVEQVFPNMVQTTETDEIKDLKSIKMSVLIPMLVKTIQELNKRIEELEKK